MHQKDNIFFHTQLWFPAPDGDFRRFESDFRCFFFFFGGGGGLSHKKHCGRNRIDHVLPCATEYTLVSSTEITRYRSWFLQKQIHEGELRSARE